MSTQRFKVPWVCAILFAFLGHVHAQGKEQPDRIATAYKTAHAKRDIKAVMSLVSFQSEDIQQRASWERDFLKEFAQPVKSVTLAPLSITPASILSDVKNRARRSVEFVNCLVVEFASEEEGITRSQVYFIGSENNAHFIVGP